MRAGLAGGAAAADWAVPAAPCTLVTALALLATLLWLWGRSSSAEAFQASDTLASKSLKLAVVPPAAGGKCIKIRLPGKLVPKDLFGNRESVFREVLHTFYKGRPIRDD